MDRSYTRSQGLGATIIAARSTRCALADPHQSKRIAAIFVRV